VTQQAMIVAQMLTSLLQILINEGNLSVSFLRLLVLIQAEQ